MAEENLTIQFWSAEVLPQKMTSLRTGSSDQAVHLKMACFGEDVNDNSRTVLYCDSNDRKAVICVLSAQNENQPLDLVFSGNASPQFTIRGTNPSKVHLSGFIQPLIDADDVEVDGLKANLDIEQPEPVQPSTEEKNFKVTNTQSPPPTVVGQKRSAEDMEELVEPPKKKQKTTAEPEQESSVKDQEPPAAAQAPSTPVTNEDNKEDDDNNNLNNNKKNEAPPAAKSSTTPETPQVGEVSTTAEQNENPEPTNKSEKKKKKKKKKKITYSSSGLGIRDLKSGSGTKAKNGSEVRIKYILQIDGTSTIVDKNLGEGFVFVVGSGDVIKGWDEGVLGLQKGGKRKLKVPPSLGYGQQGSGSIPPNATLNFTLECVSVD